MTESLWDLYKSLVVSGTAQLFCTVSSYRWTHLHPQMGEVHNIKGCLFTNNTKKQKVLNTYLKKVLSVSCNQLLIRYNVFHKVISKKLHKWEKSTCRRHIGHSIGPFHCRDCQYATMQLPVTNKYNVILLSLWMAAHPSDPVATLQLEVTTTFCYQQWFVCSKDISTTYRMCIQGYSSGFGIVLFNLWAVLGMIWNQIISIHDLKSHAITLILISNHFAINDFWFWFEIEMFMILWFHQS